jgi:hypothetical protein
VHRTTTTATLLVTAAVAVSALTGCVTIPRVPEPGPAAASARPPGPRPDGGAAGPPAVRQAPPRQAPPRQALERTGPSAGSDPTARPRHRPAAGAGAAPTDRAPRHAAPAPHSPDHRPPHPAPRPHRPHRTPHSGAPAAVPPVPGNPGLCSLGRQYGHWRPDSPEARICGQTFGR